MSFDAIDRQYRRREIKLECAQCLTTEDHVATRYAGDDDAVVLCRTCYFKREENGCYY